MRLKTAFLVLFFISCNLNASPPKDWGYLKSKPVGFKPCGVMSRDSLNILIKKGAIRRAGQKGVIASTTYKVLVIRVHFTGGAAITKTKAETEVFFETLQDYFRENSYNLLTVTATVTNNDYTLPSPVSSYNTESNSALQLLINDSVSQAKYDYNLSQFTHIMIYHEGHGEEESRNPSDLWSLFYDYSYTVSGGITTTKTFTGFTVVPEQASGSSPLGVICHEYGHQLGLPDLYNTMVTGGESTCGAWSLMDYPYGYDNTGSNPPHLDPWCKNYLSFIDLSSREISSGSSSLYMGDIETSQTTGFFKIPIDSSPKEYFIAELRTPDAAKMQFDLSIPGSGLLIWHIDDAIATDAARFAANTINSGSPHYGIDLVEADLNKDYPPGRPTNAFVNGASFSTPMSDTFEGLPSSISIANINITGTSLTLSVAKLASSASLEIIKAINYPNPAGLGYAHPRKASGIITTIVFNLSKAPQNMDLTIYNIAGELVKSVSKDKMTFSLIPSADYKWVYEYDWNGKNDSGEDVAQGLYIYKLKVDGIIKVGKLAIAR